MTCPPRGSLSRQAAGTLDFFCPLDDPPHPTYEHKQAPTDHILSSFFAHVPNTMMSALGCLLFPNAR